MFNSLLKALNKEKIKNVKHYASMRGVSKDVLESESVMKLMSYPEATAITIL